MNADRLFGIFPCAGLACYAVIVVILIRMQQHAPRRGLVCNKCNYSLKGLEKQNSCPECGHAVTDRPPDSAELAYDDRLTIRRLIVGLTCAAAVCGAMLSVLSELPILARVWGFGIAIACIVICTAVSYVLVPVLKRWASWLLAIGSPCVCAGCLSAVWYYDLRIEGGDLAGLSLTFGPLIALPVSGLAMLPLVLIVWAFGQMKRAEH